VDQSLSWKHCISQKLSFSNSKFCSFLIIPVLINDNKFAKENLRQTAEKEGIWHFAEYHKM
jgi:hypothetical protein